MPPPTITNVIGPRGLAQAKVGETVNINGLFTTVPPPPNSPAVGDNVRFGLQLPRLPEDSIRAQYTKESDILLTARVPLGADAFPTPAIAVFVSDGNQTSLPFPFIVEEMTPPSQQPLINSFTPTSGTVGTVVTISGRGFDDTTSVGFNALNAESFKVISDTTLTATVPENASTGPISVTTRVGTTRSAINFVVTEPPPKAPEITSITPESGRIGDQVTIIGQHLGKTSKVRFKDSLGQSKVDATFEVIGGRRVTATVPPLAQTGTIRVVTDAGAAVSPIFTVIS